MTEISRDQPKHVVIARDLREQIRSGRLKHGDMLPSYRELMKRYTAPPSAVRRAIERLQSESIIRTVPGAGSVVDTDHETQRRQVGVVIGLRSAPLSRESDLQKAAFLDRELVLLHDELDACQCDLILRYVDPNDEATHEPLMPWIERMDSVMLIGRLPVELLHRVADRGRPAVLVGVPVDGECPHQLSQVTADFDAIADLAIHEAVASGHRRIGLWCHQGTEYFDRLAESVAGHAAHAGLSEHFQAFRSDDRQNGDPTEVLSWLKSLEQPPTVLIVENGGRASEMLATLEAADWDVPRRISLIAITAAKDTAELVEGVSSVVLPVRKLFSKAAAVALELSRHGERRVVRQTLGPRWLRGHTCGSPSPSATRKSPTFPPTI